MSEILTNELLETKTKDNSIMSELEDVDAFDVLINNSLATGSNRVSQNEILRLHPKVAHISIGSDYKFYEIYDECKVRDIHFPMNIDRDDLKNKLEDFIVKHMVDYFNSTLVNTDLAETRADGKILTAKESLTYSLFLSTKEFCNKYFEIPDYAIRILDVLDDKTNLLNCIDRELFINLCCNSILNEPPSNSLRIANEGKLYIVTDIFNKTFSPEYLERFGKSAYKQLLENILKYTPEDIRQEIIPPQFHSRFVAEMPFNKDFTYNTDWMSDRNIFCDNLPTAIAVIDFYEDKVISKNFSTPQKVIFYPHRHEWINNSFVSSFLKTGYLNSPLEVISKSDKDNLTGRDATLSLAIQLPTFVQTLAVLSVYDEELFEKIFPDENSWFLHRTTIASKVCNNFDVYEKYESYITSCIRSDLIGETGCSRREASDFIKNVIDIQERGDGILSNVFPDDFSKSFIKQ